MSQLADSIVDAIIDTLRRRGVLPEQGLSPQTREEMVEITDALLDDAGIVF